MQHARRSCGTTFLIMLAIVALSGTTATAQSGETAWEFGGYALQSLFANRTGIDDAPGFGVRGGYIFGGKHQFDLSYDQVTGDSPATGVTDVDVTKIGVNYVRRFQIRNKEKIFPLASFGLGTVSTDNGLQSESSVYYKVGGGAKYFLTKRLALRFDGNIYRWDGDGKALPVDSFFSFDFVVGLSFVTRGGA